MNTTYTEANIQLVKRFIKAYGIDGARHYITETIRVQKINGSTTMIATWEANLAALDSLFN